MEIIKSDIPDVWLIKPDVYRDNRGYFYESYHFERFAEAGMDYMFVQDNESMSKKGVLRGLHYQIPPFEQGKLVRVIKGAVLDVAVDIRRHSPFYGKWCSAVLTGENKFLYWIPPGFAHGFLTLEDDSIFSYKCTTVYNRDAERSIRWDDPDLNINWNFQNPVLAEKDNNAPLFKDIQSPFIMQ
ncbi:MAG: dTDP-4-dehydrorhamnose 3,5-epimerase [Bacteroidetes bacterium]|nr:dTDP-4-dehydrorhamnose 3,5-epimerase [Bacteroidota bacterium]